MRFITFLNEQTQIGLYENKIKNYLNDLKRISPLPGLLLSGRSKNTDEFVGDVRKNRVPRDTPQHIHDFFNNYFDEEYGIKARSETLFCTTTPQSTGLYGTAYMIFPFGSYEIIWNPGIVDLYDLKNISYIENVIDYLQSDNYGYDIAEEDVRREAEYLQQKLEEYQVGNLKVALDTEVEIMLDCDRYLAINLEHFDTVKEWLKDEYGIKFTRRAEINYGNY